MATRQRRKAQSQKRNEAQRKIFFYRVDVGIDEAGRLLPFDPGPLLARVNALPPREMGGRYAVEADGAVCAWVDQLTPPYRLKFGKVRWKDLPQVDHNGTLSPLTLAENDGLVDPYHVVFFRHDPYWFVGCEYSFTGPRVSRLAKYLSEKGRCTGFTIAPLIWPDRVRRLHALHDVRLFSMRVHPSYVTLLPNKPRIDQVEEFLDYAQRLGNVHTVDVVLRANPRSKQKLPNALITYALQLISGTDLRTGITDGKIKGWNVDTERVDVVDMLNAQIFARESIPRSGPRSAQLTSEAVYNAIEQAYNRVSEELIAAAAVTMGSGVIDESGNSVA